MIGEIISHHPYQGGRIVCFSALGLTDFSNQVKPWAEKNLTYPIRFVASCSVLVSEDDFTLFVLRWS